MNAQARPYPIDLDAHVRIPEAWLRTSRVRLRQWTRADLEPFAALNADPRVMRHFPSLLSREQSDAHAARMRSLIEQRGWGFWALESLIEPQGPQFIGFVGLHTPSTDLPFSPCVEIGWRLMQSAWGKGLATEAAQCALVAGFEALKLDEIVSFTSRENLRSQGVMKRLGMHSAPGDDFDHPAVPEGHPVRPHRLFRLSQSEWLERRSVGN